MALGTETLDRSRGGMWPWLGQRVTAVLVIVTIMMHLVLTHYIAIGELSFDNIGERLAGGVVLVNDIVTTGADGTTVVEPRSQEELVLLEELVASAVGIDPDRGDLLTVRSIPLEPVADFGTEATASGGSSFDLMSIIKLAVLAVVDVGELVEGVLEIS